MLARRVVVCLALALVIPAAALAAPTTLDFSVLGINTLDITAQNSPAGFTLDGVTMFYDNFGTATDMFGNPATAQVDQAGVWGSTWGPVIFNFAAPVNQVSFNWSLLGATADSADGLVFMPQSGGQWLDDQIAIVPWGAGDTSLAFEYSGLPIDSITLYFSLDAPFFAVDTITYSEAPEPATFAALALGGLAIMRRRRRRSRV